MKVKTEYGCRFNSIAIMCEEWDESHDERLCAKCGWNPEVEASRKAELRERFGVNDEEEFIS